MSVTVWRIATDTKSYEADDLSGAGAKATGGRWNGKQILPPGWLQMATARSTAQGAGRGYGAMVWRIGDPDAGECKAYGLPTDTVAMSGQWGQIVAMVPSRDAVIVRLGWTFRRKQFDACAFVAAVLKVLLH